MTAFDELTGQRLTGIAPGLAAFLGDVLDEAFQVAMPPLLAGRSPDISNYDTPTFDVDCFTRQANVRRVIIGCQWEGHARPQLAALQRAGVPRHVYAFLYFGGAQPERATRLAIALAREFEAPVVWLDAEADGIDAAAANTDDPFAGLPTE